MSVEFVYFNKDFFCIIIILLYFNGKSEGTKPVI